MEVGDEDLSWNKETRIIDVTEIMKVPENYHVGIRVSSLQKCSTGCN